MMGNEGRINAANMDINDQWFSHVRSDLWNLADNVRTHRRITRRARRAADRAAITGIEDEPGGRVPEMIWAGPGIVRGIGCHGEDGYLLLNPARLAELPAALRTAGGWYPDPCASALVVLGFPDLFTEQQREHAHRIGAFVFADAYRQVFGEAARQAVIARHTDADKPADHI